MKKLILSLAVVIGLAFTASAQTEGAVNKISIGGDFLYPATGFLADSYNLGYGASVEGEYNIWKKLNLTISASYLKMAYEQAVKDAYPEGISDDVYFPVKLGGKYYFEKFYVSANAGVAVASSDDRNSVFIYAAGIGKAFSVAPKSNIDFGLTFRGWTSYINSLNTKPSTSTFVGLRAAYSFGL
jgi:hypothetical protein